jgi:integrase
VVGAGIVLALAPRDARLSWLTKPTHLTELYRRAIRGDDHGGGARSPNSVRRSVHQAVAAVLRAYFGRGKMLAIVADAEVPAVSDERSVMMTVAEVQRALDVADDEFRPVLGLAVTTGIDRAPLRAGILADYDDEQGTLQVRDRKTAARPRMLLLRGEPVLEHAEHWLKRLVARRTDLGAPLVAFTNRQIQTRWEAIREEIGRPEVRWKDLRGIFATHYLLAGGDTRDLQHILGHSTTAMTLRYLRRLPPGNRARLQEGARHLGRWRPPPRPCGDPE